MVNMLGVLAYFKNGLINIDVAANLSLAICIAMTTVQTYAVSIKHDEHRPAVSGDADHLCIIQSAVMQYVGLYLRVTKAGWNNNRTNKTIYLWVMINMVCPLASILAYPSHNYLSPFLLFLGTIGGSLTDVCQMQTQVEDVLVN
ncbi:hypothetical protein BJ166DRAFT_523617 [Pestalotiopsis sp. NC0098]|nr:hypothetical protein BJ166DRAFT_523617 [Pestalotiopsis sp. NC0098]